MFAIYKVRNESVLIQIVLTLILLDEIFRNQLHFFFGSGFAIIKIKASFDFYGIQTYKIPHIVNLQGFPNNLLSFYKKQILVCLQLMNFH